MAINYNDSLARLRSRRLGYDRGPQATVAFSESLQKRERYEGRATSTATRYALGAMQEVDPDYTRICHEEGDRVAAQLRNGFAALNRTAAYRLQGSVPLNTHIRGASDVDLLVLHEASLTYDVTGPLGRNGWYSPYKGSVLQDVIDLRRSCEQILTSSFPKVNVDRSHNKCIRLTGGSLRRDVDVVPAHWNDKVAYQRSLNEHDRGVSILDKSVPTTIDNLPFLHIKRIDERDRAHAGGVRMSIRLVKNVIADGDKDIALSSYDVAGLMWNAPDGHLLFQPRRELMILHATDEWLSALAGDYARAAALVTPDGSRKVINEPAKFTALVRLAAEVSALATDVASEWAQLMKSLHPIQDSSRSRVLRSVEIPA